MLHAFVLSRQAGLGRRCCLPKLHAATCCEAHQRDKREKLRRYITRPATANEGLSTNARGQDILPLSVTRQGHASGDGFASRHGPQRKMSSGGTDDAR